VTLVDSNVLLDLFTADENWEGWSRRQLGTAILADGACINPIIYAEVSIGFAHERELAEQMKLLGIERRELPYQAAFAAGRAFLRYRRSGGRERSPLPDFYIGAHAECDGLALLTRDAKRYRSYFPNVRIVSPDDKA
jgi:predicted nucleic acid-binding protein